MIEDRNTYWFNLRHICWFQRNFSIFFIATRDCNLKGLLNNIQKNKEYGSIIKKWFKPQIYLELINAVEDTWGLNIDVIYRTTTALIITPDKGQIVVTRIIKHTSHVRDVSNKCARV